jgi:hypothetical protein
MREPPTNSCDDLVIRKRQGGRQENRSLPNGSRTSPGDFGTSYGKNSNLYLQIC